MGAPRNLRARGEELACAASARDLPDVREPGSARLCPRGRMAVHVRAARSRRLLGRPGLGHHLPGDHRLKCGVGLRGEEAGHGQDLGRLRGHDRGGPHGLLAVHGVLAALPVGSAVRSRRRCYRCRAQQLRCHSLRLSSHELAALHVGRRRQCRSHDRRSLPGWLHVERRL